MRIVLDLQACQAANARQGIGRYSLEFTRAFLRLASGRHEVMVALNGAFPAAAERVRAELGGLIAADKVVVWQAPSPCDGRSGGAREVLARELRRQFLESLGADIVHTTSVFEGFGDDAITAITPAVERGYAESAILYDLIPLVHDDIYLADPGMNTWYRRKVDDLRNADLLLSISDFSRREGIELLQCNPATVVNMSSGVNPAFRRKVDAADVKRRHGIRGGMVMYGGGIDVRKNVERLIQAYALLPSSVRENRQLAIVCRISDHHRDAFARLAQDAGLRDDELVMTGYVNDEDLISFYSACDLFVFPSWHEGFGLPPLEAMACGAPVIVSNVTSLPEVVGCAEATFDPHSVKSIADAMERVLTDQAWAEELARQGMEQSKKYSWENTAGIALREFERIAPRRSRKKEKQSLPRLAYVSPLPPEQSGISDYGTELLPSLKRHYRITAITPSWEESAKLPGIDIRGIEWFREHASEFDRVIYQFGNSAFHTAMFDLADEIPGITVLHDFFLSGIVSYLSNTREKPWLWDEYLYRSHGYEALLRKAAEMDDSAPVWMYPANLPVIDRAIRVIVHSNHAVELAREWYGEAVAGHFDVIPQLHAAVTGAGRAKDRAAARKRLGIDDDELVVCSFGMIGPNKLSARLLGAWGRMDDKGAANERLVFVGQNQATAYGSDFEAGLAACQGRVAVTGFVDDQTYQDYLLAADMAVQLRTLSRGETSRAALDCIASGLPLVVNSNGSMAEIPRPCAVMIGDDFDDDELLAAIESLRDRGVRSRMSMTQIEYAHKELAPGLVAERYHSVIEAAYAHPANRSLAALGSRLPVEMKRDAGLMRECCEALAWNNPGNGPKQLLLDVSELANHDARSGIQRVVRGVLNVALADGLADMADYRVEPVYTSGDGKYRYARKFVEGMLGVATECPDEPVTVRRGDVFLGLDLVPVDAVRAEKALMDMKLAGAQVMFVVYDVLPMQRPDCFPPEADGVFRPWAEMVARIADGVLCISRQVCRDFAEAADALRVERALPLPLWHFPLGLSLPAASPSEGPLSERVRALTQSPGKLVLMVGTIEPRKGHAHALAAMEALWADGDDVSLVIVGKQGWMVEPVIDAMQRHPRNGRQLHWLTGVSDSELDSLYVRADVALCASEAEGYGLPLIEAASRNVPIVARDIPIFREVAGTFASFFEGDDPVAMASAILQALQKGRGGAVDEQRIGDFPSWHQATRHMLEVLNGRISPDVVWKSGDRHVFWAHSRAISGPGIVLDHGSLVPAVGELLDFRLEAPLQPGRWRMNLPALMPVASESVMVAVSATSGATVQVAGPTNARTLELDIDESVAGLRIRLSSSLRRAAIGAVILERLDTRRNVVPEMEATEMLAL